MKKNILLLMLAAVSVAWTGCKKFDPHKGMSLSMTDVVISRGETSFTPITSQEWDFSASIDDPQIAEVGIEWLQTGPHLMIRGLKVGKTGVTVKDGKGNTAKCALSVKFSEVSLLQTTFSIGILNQDYQIPIIGGSGRLSADSSDPDVAEGRISPSGLELVINAKKEGTATLTVTDTERKNRATCSLTVKEIAGIFYVTGTRQAVEAADNEVKKSIETEVEQNPRFPAGSRFLLKGGNGGFMAPEGSWKVEDPEGKEISTGIYTMESAKEVPPVYAIFPFEGQIYSCMKVTVNEQGNKSVYYLFIVNGPAVRDLWREYNVRFVEDLTGYYQTKYPVAGVKGVVRGYVCSYSTGN